MINNMYNAYSNNMGYANPMIYNPQQKPAHQIFNMTPVKGFDGAKSYPIANDVTMPLWDEDNHKIYIKSTDMDGTATYQILSYTIEDTESDSKYMTKDEFTKYMDNYMSKFKEMINNGESTIRNPEQTVSDVESRATNIPVFQ